MTLRTGSLILVFCCTAAIGCDYAVGYAADSALEVVGAGDDDLVKLPGPFPQMVEGELEVADIQDAGGDDYLMSGWITTGEGTVYVQSLGAVLKAGDAEEDGRVRARVKPSAADIPDNYDIVEIQRIP